VILPPQGAAEQLGRVRERAQVELARLFGPGADT
jgi:hypothetical protein